jgi:hypothetical protein
MLLALLALGLLVAFWMARRTCSDRVGYLLLPQDDQPPATCDHPWPSARALDRYVDRGLDEIDAFLAGLDFTA